VTVIPTHDSDAARRLVSSSSLRAPACMSPAPCRSSNA
jgi:hypothetical protein